MPDDSERRSLTASMRLALMPMVKRFLDNKTTGLGPARQFLRSLGEVQKPRGRPPGKAYNDEPHLIEMGRLLEIGEVTRRYGAAKIVVRSEQFARHAEEESEIRRLCDRFKEDELRYRRLGREKTGNDLLDWDS